MKLNIAKIYKKNIFDRYGPFEREKFEKDYSNKEQSMWNFTLDLLKDNYPQEEYDSEEKNEYILKYLKIFLLDDGVTYFTIQEWFEYLNSKK